LKIIPDPSGLNRIAWPDKLSWDDEAQVLSAGGCRPRLSIFLGRLLSLSGGGDISVALIAPWSNSPAVDPVQKSL
jgi:hypothetical protein